MRCRKTICEKLGRASRQGDAPTGLRCSAVGMHEGKGFWRCSGKCKRGRARCRGLGRSLEWFARFVFILGSAKGGFDSMARVSRALNQ